MEQSCFEGVHCTHSYGTCMLIMQEQAPFVVGKLPTRV
jgi:hypothetical protein